MWKSAAFTYQYLLWLEKSGEKVDWSLETLKGIKAKYVTVAGSKAQEYIKHRVKSITDLIKKASLSVAAGSTFEEVKK